jgi:hypothetical protein
MDDLWSSETEAIGRAWAPDGITPFCTILCAILGVAVCGGA